MRFPRVRAALAGLLLFGCEDGAIESTVRIDSTSKRYGALVDACRADDLACEALCLSVLGNDGEDPNSLSLTECRIRDLSPTVTEVEMEYDYPQACGRRPEGFARPVAACASVGTFLARAAELEHASIAAFDRLEAELTALRAPAPLIAASRAAARDEARHAALVGRLAGALGAAPRMTPPAAHPLRGAAAIAEENAAEGCVGEAFGALVASWQASSARDPAVARVMASIAPDELRHAQLSFAVDRWLGKLLSTVERRRVADARRRALDELSRQLASAARAGQDAGATWLGLPSGGEVAMLLAAASPVLAG